MHEIVADEFESHLSGEASAAFYSHLAACPDCRAEIAAMEDISACVRELKFPDSSAPEIPLGFYNRVAGQIIEKQRNEAWGLFSPGVPFFRRIAFASLLLLAGLGSFLITREADEGGTDAAAIMAQHDVTGVHAESADRDRLLVTLASYGQ